MNTPTPRQIEIASAVAEHGSHRKAAQALGVRHSNVDCVIARLKRNHPDLFRGGFDPAAVSHYWHKTPPKNDEPGVSAFVKVERGQVIDGLRAALAAYDGKAKAKAPPKDVAADLLNVVVAPDIHVGMHAWAREAGQDYSTKIAAQRMADVFGSVMPRLPKAGGCVLLFPGDTLHQNDARNMTPKSGHVLDVDGRLLKVAETAVSIILAAVDMARAAHETVEVVILPGNHDPEMALMIALAVRMYFAKEPRVTVHDGAGLWWRRTFGAVMLAATHLHAIKFAGIGPYVAAEWPQEWGATRHRYAFTGHEHRERTQDFPGIHVETLRPITRRDAYAAGAYQSMCELSAMTFHKGRGRVSRIYEAIT